MKSRTGLGEAVALVHARNPMAAQQIPSNEQGLRPGTGSSGCGRRWLFGSKSPAKRRELRRHGPVSVQVPFSTPARAGGAYMTAFDRRHTSVLGREAVEWLAPRDGGIFVDATFGAGGYSRAILEVPGTRVIGLDRDRTAIAAGVGPVDREGGRTPLGGGPFSQLARTRPAQRGDSAGGAALGGRRSPLHTDPSSRGL